MNYYVVWEDNARNEVAAEFVNKTTVPRLERPQQARGVA